MEAIDFAKPNTVNEAVELMASKGDRARMLAGGTDLLVQLRAGRRSIDLVVDAKSIPELNQITYDPQNGLTLGASVPCYQIYQNEAVANAYPGLIDCASLIGGIQIQGRASIGGNLCNAAPSGDSIPAVIALGGVARIAGPNGTRDSALRGLLYRSWEKRPAGRGNTGLDTHTAPPGPLRRQLPAVHPA